MTNVGDWVTVTYTDMHLPNRPTVSFEGLVVEIRPSDGTPSQRTIRVEPAPGRSHGWWHDHQVAVR